MLGLSIQSNVGGSDNELGDMYPISCAHEVQFRGHSFGDIVLNSFSLSTDVP